jgi:hypothetical protein
VLELELILLEYRKVVVERARLDCLVLEVVKFICYRQLAVERW